MSEPVPGRISYREELTKLATEDERIVCIEVDLGGAGHPFATSFPSRFFNVGIAESAAIDLAVGLAADGWRPFVSTFAPFATLRAAESIKLGLGYAGAPITVVAPYAGVSGAWFGTTHHCLEDLAVMRSIPGVRIAVPFGERAMRECVRRALATDGATYIRTGRNAAYTTPAGVDVHRPVSWLSSGDSNSSPCLVGVGEEGTRLALEVAPDLDGEVANLTYIDEASLTLAAAELAHREGPIVVVEEHRAAGGVGEGLARLIPSRWVATVSANQSWPTKGGSHEEVMEQVGLTAQAVRDVVAACR